MGSFIKDYIELYYASRKENTVCDFIWTSFVRGDKFQLIDTCIKKIGDAAFNEGF